jgi:hypothetical protein
MEELDHLGAHAHLKLLLDKGIGHRIVVAVDFDMIINVDAGQFPLGIFIGLGREGLQGGAVEHLKKTLSGAGEFLEGAAIEGGQELADCGVHLGECKEGVMP